MDWEKAKTHCAGLSLDGGGWRLPTVSELRSLIRGCPTTEDGGICRIEEGVCQTWSCWDDSCDSCSALGGRPAADRMYWPSTMQANPASYGYWSSTQIPDSGSYAWAVFFHTASVIHVTADNDLAVRCVR